MESKKIITLSIIAALFLCRWGKQKNTSTDSDDILDDKDIILDFDFNIDREDLDKEPIFHNDYWHPVTYRYADKTVADQYRLSYSEEDFSDIVSNFSMDSQQVILNVGTDEHGGIPYVEEEYFEDSMYTRLDKISRGELGRFKSIYTEVDTNGLFSSNIFRSAANQAVVRQKKFSNSKVFPEVAKNNRGIDWNLIETNVEFSASPVEISKDRLHYRESLGSSVLRLKPVNVGNPGPFPSYHTNIVDNNDIFVITGRLSGHDAISFANIVKKGGLFKGMAKGKESFSYPIGYLPSHMVAKISYTDRAIREYGRYGPFGRNYLLSLERDLKNKLFRWVYDTGPNNLSIRGFPGWKSTVNVDGVPDSEVDVLIPVNIQQGRVYGEYQGCNNYTNQGLHLFPNGERGYQLSDEFDVYPLFTVNGVYDNIVSIAITNNRKPKHVIAKRLGVQLDDIAGFIQPVGNQVIGSEYGIYEPEVSSMDIESGYYYNDSIAPGSDDKVGVEGLRLAGKFSDNYPIELITEREDYHSYRWTHDSTGKVISEVHDEAFIAFNWKKGNNMFGRMISCALYNTYETPPL